LVGSLCFLEGTVVEADVQVVLNGVALAVLDLVVDDVQTRVKGGVPEVISVFLDEVRVAVDIRGDTLGRRWVELDATSLGRLDER